MKTNKENKIGKFICPHCGCSSFNAVIIGGIKWTMDDNGNHAREVPLIEDSTIEPDPIKTFAEPDVENMRCRNCGEKAALMERVLNGSDPRITMVSITPYSESQTAQPITFPRWIVRRFWIDSSVHRAMEFDKWVQEQANFYAKDLVKYAKEYGIDVTAKPPRRAAGFFLGENVTILDMSPVYHLNPKYLSGTIKKVGITYLTVEVTDDSFGPKPVSYPTRFYIKPAPLCEEHCNRERLLFHTRDEAEWHYQQVVGREKLVSAVKQKKVDIEKLPLWVLQILANPADAKVEV